VFRLVILPLIVPGMAAAAVLVFIAAWNEFLLALILIQDPARRVIQPAINLLVGSDTHTPWHIVSATTLIACVPVCIIFVFLQKYLVSGLTAGAIKG
jgi:multiple sugar transport system permease protein